MHVCLICSEFLGFGTAGGFGFATRSLGRNLAARGHRVSVVMPQPVGLNDTRIRLDGIDVMTFPRSDIFGAAGLYRDLRADVYHSQHPSLSTHVAQRSAPGAAHVVTVRDPRNISDWWVEFVYPSRTRFGVLKTMAFYENPLVWAAVRRASRVFVPAGCLVGKVRKKYLLGCAPEFLPTPVAMPDGGVRKAEKPTLCYIGRLDRRKRPDRFLALAPLFPDADFLVVGGAQDPRYERELMRRFGTAGNVRLLGFVDQFASDALHQVLASSWIMVNTAMREGLPNVFIEAAAHGCAIVSAHDPDGFASRFGRHCPDGRFDRAVASLIGDGSWRQRGQLGAAHVRAINSEDTATQRHEEVYSSLLASGPSRKAEVP